MADKQFKSRIILKHDLESNWLKAVNFIPKQGEVIIYDKDNNYDYERLKIGDGASNVNDLPFASTISDWNATSGIAQIQNKPTALSAFTNDVNFVTADEVKMPVATTVEVSAATTTVNLPSALTNTESLAVYYNGLLMVPTKNYTATSTQINLVGFTADPGDTFTFVSTELVGDSLNGDASNVIISDPNNAFHGATSVEGALNYIAQNYLTEIGHNLSTLSHTDIRELVASLDRRLTGVANSDDETLDQLSEIVAYIKNNKSLIDGITTSKVSVSDIVDNLTSTSTNKPLSAAQGKALKALIDAIVVPTKVSELENDEGYLKEHQSLDNYALKSELFSKNYNDLNNKPTIPTVPTNVSGFTNDAGYLTEQDISDKANVSDIPSVPSWALASTKPTYTASEVGAIPFQNTYTADCNTWLTSGYTKTALSNPVTAHLPDGCPGTTSAWGVLFFIAENAANGTGTQMYYPIDGPYKGCVFVRAITNGKNSSGSFGTWKRMILSSDISSWALANTKPTYTASEVGALPSSTVIPTVPTAVSAFTNDSGYLTQQDISGKVDKVDGKELSSNDFTTALKTKLDNINVSGDISTHNLSNTSHDDIRRLVSGLEERLNGIADSDDTTLDQLSEIVAYIKNNKSLIDNITTNKVSISDIIDTLTSTATNQPLSANQGRALKALIDAIVVPTNVSELTNDSGFITSSNIPTKVSELTNDSGYLTEHQPLTDYALKTELFSKNYEELSNKPTIPTSTSELTNDSGFITNDDVDMSNYMQKTDYVEAGRRSGTTKGNYSTVEGNDNVATALYSHAEGTGNIASGKAAHTEGSSTKATGHYSHSEGMTTSASGQSSHAEGTDSTASGNSAHAEGSSTKAKGDYSHSEGVGTIARGIASHASGKYNIEDIDFKYAEIVGNGNSSTRANARTLDWDGNAWYAGKVTVGADPTEDMDLATKQYVDSHSSVPNSVSVEVTVDNTTTITLPESFSSTEDISVYYNGLLLVLATHYTFANGVITLNGFAAKTRDIFTFVSYGIVTGISQNVNASEVVVSDVAGNFEGAASVEGALKYLAENLGKVEDVIPISKGGTGATTAEQAKINLKIPTDIITTNDEGVATTPVPLNADMLNGHPDTYFAKATDIPDTSELMPKSGGTFTGTIKAQANTNYTTSQLRNVIISTAAPSGGSNGDIWIKYKA